MMQPSRRHKKCVYVGVVAVCSIIVLVYEMGDILSAHAPMSPELETSILVRKLAANKNVRPGESTSLRKEQDLRGPMRSSSSKRTTGVPKLYIVSSVPPVPSAKAVPAGRTAYGTRETDESTNSETIPDDSIGLKVVDDTSIDSLTGRMKNLSARIDQLLNVKSVGGSGATFVTTPKAPLDSAPPKAPDQNQDIVSGSVNGNNNAIDDLSHVLHMPLASKTHPMNSSNNEDMIKGGPNGNIDADKGHSRNDMYSNSNVPGLKNLERNPLDTFINFYSQRVNGMQNKVTTVNPFIVNVPRLQQTTMPPFLLQRTTMAPFNPYVLSGGNSEQPAASGGNESQQQTSKQTSINGNRSVHQDPRTNAQLEPVENNGVHVESAAQLLNGNGAQPQPRPGTTVPPDFVKRRTSTIPPPPSHPPSCSLLFQGDERTQIDAANYALWNPFKPIQPEEYLKLTTNCEKFKWSRQYITKPLSADEAQFPIAYSILVHSSVQQTERLLRSIYHPQNYYCLHVDKKADINMRSAILAIASCFKNVFVSSQSEMVYWGHISIIYAEMHCMRDLMQFDWKYYINLSGQMFPLHSNRELVKILQMYDGANDIEGTYARAQKTKYLVRYQYRHYLDERRTGYNRMVQTGMTKFKTPYNVLVYKGSNQIVATRAFVDFFLTSQIAKDIIEYFSDALAADEFIYATLNHNPKLNVPGSFKGDPETKPTTARASVWADGTDQVNWSWDHWSCRGRWVRYICIFGVGDLPWLYKRPELFANKFFEDNQYYVYNCMEELIRNRTFNPEQSYLDIAYYKKLPFVKDKDLLVIR